MDTSFTIPCTEKCESTPSSKSPKVVLATARSQAKLLGQLTSSMQRLRRWRGGRGNKYPIGHLTRSTSPALHSGKYKSATSQQHQLYGPSQSTTASASKSGTDGKTKHTTELYTYILL